MSGGGVVCVFTIVSALGRSVLFKKKKFINSVRPWELSADRRQCNTTCPAALRAHHEMRMYQDLGNEQSE